MQGEERSVPRNSPEEGLEATEREKIETRAYGIWETRRKLLDPLNEEDPPEQKEADWENAEEAYNLRKKLGLLR